MRLRAARLVHVFAWAPVTAAVAAALGSPAHALAATPAVPAARPAPIVIAVDPGHGGTADNSDPSKQWDPGVIAPDGTAEKTLTLDVGLRLERLLRAEMVDVAMTRTTDTFLSIADREQVADDAGASLFVSIHFNSYTDPSTGGSLVLYPNDASLDFAKTMSNALGRGLQAAGIDDDGVQLRDDLWVHATMPTVTVEAAYLTDPSDLSWLHSANATQDIAQSILNGLEAQDPDILARKTQILAWDAAHQPAAQSASHSEAAVAGSPAAALLPWLVVLAMCLAGVRFRERLAPLAATALRRGGAGAAGGVERIVASFQVDRRRGPHRRRVQRRRATLARARNRASVAAERRRGGYGGVVPTYDELWL